jgi:outer membrane biosynthesis protein TonB
LSGGYPRQARRAGAQADVHAAIHVDPVTGKVREVEIKLVKGSEKEVFAAATREGLATAEFSVDGIARDAKPMACMSVRYRLGGYSSD